MAMLLWALACALAHALADKDASCMLQAKKAQVAGSLTQKQKPKPEFCKQGTAELNFESFEHGDRIRANSIRQVTIAAKPRGKNPKCTGPLLVLDTSKATLDEDLQKCGKSKLLIYSQDGNRNTLNDCSDVPGPVVTFTFGKLQDIESVDLCDQEVESTIKVYNKKGRLIKAVKGPSGGGQDGKNANVVVKERGVRKLEIELGGAGDAIRRITACKPRASVFGDPHIYTLDGGKFDLYQNGTFTVFHYSGQKVSDSGKGAASSEVDWQLYAHYGGPRWTVQGLLLVDRSLGRFRQALELTAKDCQWRSRGQGSSWSEMKKKQSLSLLEDGNYVTGFNYFSEKHIDLQMNTPAGVKDTLTLNTVCKPSGINMRISMPDMAEHRFLTGQIEVGNAEQQQLFAVTKAWESLGGSGATASYLQQLQGEQYSLVTSCSEEEREQAEKVCATHLGEHLLDAEGPDADFFQDCIFDVCRGGEEFAVAAAELLSAA